MSETYLKPVARSEIKLKESTETAWYSFTLVSASLAYFQHANKYANEAETYLRLFPAVTLFYFSLFENV